MTYGQIVGSIVLTLFAMLVSLGAILAMVLLVVEVRKYLKQEAK